MHNSDRWLRHVNSTLLVLIVMINGYVLLMPLVPALWYRVSAQSGLSVQLNDVVNSSTPTKPAQRNESYRIVIPRMLLDEQIYSMGDSHGLSKGVWNIPGTSTPDRGGNTVLAAHRFTYKHPKGTFYHLDKLQKGDVIGVFWNTKRYTYVVDNIYVVSPSQTGVQNRTPDARLTLYTCTPLWKPDNRLVVVATRIKED